VAPYAIPLAGVGTGAAKGFVGGGEEAEECGEASGAGDEGLGVGWAVTLGLGVEGRTGVVYLLSTVLLYILYKVSQSQWSSRHHTLFHRVHQKIRRTVSVVYNTLPRRWLPQVPPAKSPCPREQIIHFMTTNCHYKSFH
jgi:hypothetical protein